MRSQPILFHVEEKVKKEPIDEDACAESQETQESIETQVWVKIMDISVTNLDKKILTSGEKLTDKHIYLAQRILKAKFPNINGLCLTLLQDKPHKESTCNALQISSVSVEITGYVLLSLAHHAGRC